MFKTAFGNPVMGSTETLAWFSHFKGDRMLVNDECNGQSTVSTTLENIEKVCQTVYQDHQRATDNICEIVGIHRTCLKTVTDNLNMERVTAKFVPQLLSVDQKLHLPDICSKLKEQAVTDLNFQTTVNPVKQSSVPADQKRLRQRKRAASSQC